MCMYAIALHVRSTPLVACEHCVACAFHLVRCSSRILLCARIWLCPILCGTIFTRRSHLHLCSCRCTITYSAVIVPRQLQPAIAALHNTLFILRVLASLSFPHSGLQAVISSSCSRSKPSRSELDRCLFSSPLLDRRLVSLHSLSLAPPPPPPPPPPPSALPFLSSSPLSSSPLSPLSLPPSL